jgi:uncharacterized protein with HEPN domain
MPKIFEDAAPGTEAVFSSRTLQDAIIHNLQVLCESTQRIDARHKDRRPEIHWASIAGMRNALVHDYFDADFRWRVSLSAAPDNDFFGSVNKMPSVRVCQSDDGLSAAGRRSELQ